MEEKKQVDVGNALVVPRGDYAQVLEEIVAAGHCPFCEEHLFKYHTNPILYRTRHWLVTKNFKPYEGSRFHILFIAREHIEKIEEMSATAWLDLRDLHRRFVVENAIEGATFFIRSGLMTLTGATVTHLHAHLVVGGPRTESAEPIKALVGFKK